MQHRQSKSSNKYWQRVRRSELITQHLRQVSNPAPPCAPTAGMAALPPPGALPNPLWNRCETGVKPVRHTAGGNHEEDQDISPVSSLPAQGPHGKPQRLRRHHHSGFPCRTNPPLPNLGSSAQKFVFNFLKSRYYEDWPQWSLLSSLQRFRYGLWAATWLVKSTL